MLELEIDIDSIEAHEKRGSELHGDHENLHEDEVFDLDNREYEYFTETLHELVEDGELKFLRVFQINDWKVGKKKPKLPGIEMQFKVVIEKEMRIYKRVLGIPTEYDDKISKYSRCQTKSEIINLAVQQSQKEKYTHLIQKIVFEKEMTTTAYDFYSYLDILSELGGLGASIKILMSSMAFVYMMIFIWLLA